MLKRIRGLASTGSPGYRRALGDGAWAAVGFISLGIAGFCGSRVLIEFVSPRVFGTVSLWLGILVFAKNIMVMPVSHTVTRFYADAQHHGYVGALRDSVRREMRLTWIITASIVLGCAVAVPVYTKISLVVFLMAINFAADAVRTLVITFLGAARRQRAYAIWGTADATARPAFAIVLVLLIGRSPEVVMTGFDVGCVVVLFVAMALLNGGGGAATHDDAAFETGSRSVPELTREMRQYYVPLVPLAVVLWINSVSDRYIVGYKLGAAAVGVYSAAYSVMSVPFFALYMIVLQTVRPIYLQARVRGQQDRARQIFSMWVLLVVVPCSLGVVAVCVVPNLFGMLLLSKNYRGGVAFFPMLALGNAVYATGQVFEARMLADKRTGMLAATQTVGAVVAIVVVYLLVQKHGALGAAEGCPIYYGTILSLQIAIVLRSKTTPKSFVQ